MVAAFETGAPEELLKLQHEISDKTYTPGPYTSFSIHDPKRRWISAAPFRDRIMHHALCQVIEPHFERRFIVNSFANRKGKGTHAALDLAQRFSRRYNYVLPCDIEQFFPAIDHLILSEGLRLVIRDRDLLWLCETILAGGKHVLQEEYTMRYFPGDDLLAVLRSRGLPIGNLTSQFWANVYLDPLDQFIKRQLRCRGYLRYVDDFLLFSDQKKTLWEWRARLVDKLSELRLTLHPGSSHPRPVGEGVPYLGFVVYPHHRKLKRRKGIAYQRRLKWLLAAYWSGEITRSDLEASIRGWVNHARHGDTYRLRRKFFSTVSFVPPKGHSS